MFYCKVLIQQNCLLAVAAVTLIFYAVLSSHCLVHRVHRALSPIDLDESEEALVGRSANSSKRSSPEPAVRLIPLINFVDLNNQNEEPNKYRQLGGNNLKPVRRLPDALVIGVKKSGTRALLEFLRLHPDVRAAGSEVHFFDRHYLKGFNWYRRRMPPTLDGQITMEKTPSYFVTKEVPGRVRKMDPKVKLLVVVRDPVTRAVSDYAQAASKNKNRHHLQGFEKLAFVKDTRMSVVDTTWGPVRIGVYAKHLSKWLNHFPLKQILFVSGERLVGDPALEMSRVQDFLGLKRVITEKHFYFNATKGFPCLMKSEGRPTPHCLGKTKGRSHPFIDPLALERLREFYRPFNKKFYQMTGIDFNWP